MPVIPEPGNVAASRAFTTLFEVGERKAQLSQGLPFTVQRSVSGVAVPDHSAAVTLRMPSLSVR
jgi:hypothetical protein